MPPCWTETASEALLENVTPSYTEQPVLLQKSKKQKIFQHSAIALGVYGRIEIGQCPTARMIVTGGWSSLSQYDGRKFLPGVVLVLRDRHETAGRRGLQIGRSMMSELTICQGNP